MKLLFSALPCIGVEVPLQCYCIVSALQCSGLTELIYGYDLRVSTKAFARAGTETPQLDGGELDSVPLSSLGMQRRECAVSKVSKLSPNFVADVLRIFPAAKVVAVKKPNGRSTGVSHNGRMVILTKEVCFDRTKAVSDLVEALGLDVQTSSVHGPARTYSRVLGADVWLISDSSYIRDDGLACYYPEEISVLRDKNPEQLRVIQETKLEHPGWMVVPEKQEIAKLTGYAWVRVR